MDLKKRVYPCFVMRQSREMIELNTNGGTEGPLSARNCNKYSFIVKCYVFDRKKEKEIAP